ncbi:hypothetical protein GF312_18160 [Candidatus Poribacteria bacterium]|nr:hypothetical protein [Candidatus Poribacteria bacterium]
MKIKHFLPSRALFRDTWIIAFLILVLIYILPIWIFKYFPSQDGPSHIYNSFILKNYNNPEYEFSKYYDIRKAPVPNWASHVFMMLMMYVVPPLVSEKLLLTGYVILMAFSALYFVNSVGKGRIPLAFLAFFFIYNYISLMGFYNFSLGFGMFMLVLGYWWRRFDDFGVKNAVVLGILFLILYFCHPLPLVMAAFCIGVGAVVFFRPSKWKQSLFSLVCMIPSGGLTLYYVLTRDTPPVPGAWTLSRLWEYFTRNESLAFHSESQIILGKITNVIFLVLLLYSLVRDHVLKENWRLGLRISRKDLIFILCGVFFVIYIKAPDGMSGGGFIKTRLAMFPFMIIIPWFSWNMPKFLRWILVGVIISLAVIYVVHMSYYHKIINEEIEVYNSGCDSVERNTVLLPLCFDYIGKSWRIGVFTHTPGYYGYKRGCINLINYEAGGTDYFPTIFKPDFHRPTISEVHTGQANINLNVYKDNIDYVLTWAMVPGSDIEKRVMELYELVKQNGKLKIFRRKNDG